MNPAIGTLVDDPSALPEPRPALMKRMCREWLPTGEHHDLVLGWVVCAPEHGGKITHGICEACLARKLEELTEWQENQAALAIAVEHTLDVGATAGVSAAPSPAASPAMRGAGEHALGRPRADVLPSIHQTKGVS